MRESPDKDLNLEVVNPDAASIHGANIRDFFELHDVGPILEVA